MLVREMRILHFLLIGISISLAAAAAESETPRATKTKVSSADAVKPAATAAPAVAATAAPKEATKSTKATATRASKSLKPTDSRGKRTLHDFGNQGFTYPNVAGRRAGYVDESRAYYPQSGYYNGQNAIAQFPADFGAQYGHYPQYLEAPEPIIEIIIKDSNETLPIADPQPIVTKKKKEKVHVFYVNYKKDENNKLHLESPIASLNNDDNEEEEEDVVHYPAAVTPLPPVKTTTLRTIIHPDSEKYHSNSGIHVTFGSADKSQTGHVLEEHDAESIQREVLALPVSDSALNGFKYDSLSASTRADYASVPQSRSPAANQLFTGPFQQPNPSQHFQSQQQPQQLPAQHQTTYFRPPTTSVQSHQQQFPNQQQFPHQQQVPHQAAPPQFYQKQQYSQQQQHQQQQQHPQQRPSYNSAPTSALAQPLPQQQALYRKPPTPTPTSQQFHQQLQQQAHYYVNYNQQYQHKQQHQPQQHQQTAQHSQFYQGLPPKSTQSPKQSVFFPTPPPKVQELPSRQPPAPYQPIKFRPTPVPTAQLKPSPIPVKLENTNYQVHHQHQAQQSSPPQQQQQQQYSHHHQLQQHQQQHYHFNRQPQFIQQPTFSVSAPTQKPVNYYKQQQQQVPEPAPKPSGQFTQQYATQKSQFKTYQPEPSQTGASNDPNSALGLSTVQNFFDIQPSKETELLKAIPKYEQHITETIQHGQGQGGQSAQQQSNYNSFSYNNRNQVIHDIPAPNLAPSAQSQAQRPEDNSQSLSGFASSGNAALAGHYITSSSLSSQQQYNSFVPPPQGTLGGNLYHSSTPAPQFGESTDGQKIMIVTPMPPTFYNQYQTQSQSTQYNTHSGQAELHPSAQALQVQASTNFAQQPRHSATSAQSSAASGDTGSSQFSVSTYHSDVFKQLEQRNSQKAQQNNFALGSQLTQTRPVETKPYIPTPPQPESTTSAPRENVAATSTAPTVEKSAQTLLQLPDEVPEDLRQQLLTSGILNNADISVLDYDKVGDVALENLPAEHLQHFYGAGGGAHISASKKVLSVVKPNGEKVALSEKELERVKQSNSLPNKQNVDAKVDQYLKADAAAVSPADLADRQYNRYLPLKINGAQFPIPDVDELRGKKVVSVVVLAPVEAQQSLSSEVDAEIRSARDSSIDSGKEVKFLGGDLIKTLVKKPTKENFKRWLEKEARTDVEQQSVVLLVAKAADNAEQEIFMYDVTSGAVSKLNGELSSAFVNVAEENASSEDLEHASTLDPNDLESMMHKSRR